MIGVPCTTTYSCKLRVIQHVDRIPRTMSTVAQRRPKPRTRRVVLIIWDSIDHSPSCPCLLSPQFPTLTLLRSCFTAVQIFPPELLPFHSNFFATLPVPSPSDLHLPIWLYPFEVISRVYKDSLFQLLSKPLLDMTSIPTIIPVHLDCLPLTTTHALHAVILESLVMLIMIESNSKFHTMLLVHNYVQLYHNYVHLQVNLITTTFLPTIAMQRWSSCFAIMWFKVLQLPMLS